MEIGKPKAKSKYIRISVARPKKGDKIRTIVINKKKGIRVLYAGNRKKILTYLSERAKGWTKPKAKKWVEDNHKPKKSVIIKSMKNKLQRFKITLPIVKTRVIIVKDKDGNEKEVRVVEGVASSTDKDLHGDRMAPEAIQSMADTLKQHVINLNAEHDTSWQSELGEIKRLTVSDDHKLEVEALLNEMSTSNDLWYALTELNKKLGLSIGGYVKEYEMEQEEQEEGEDEKDAKWVRVYKDIELDHIAVTSRPANPKTWVSAISKSISEEQDQVMLTKKEKVIEAANQRDKKVKALARKIARRVQDIEANLLLELTESVLEKFNDIQLDSIEEQFDLLERKAKNMSKKDVSLEAKEAKKKANAKGSKPEDEKDETAANPENESSKEESDVEKESKGKTKDTKAEEEKSAKEETSKEEGAEEGSEESESEEDESEDDSGKGKEKAGKEDSKEKSQKAGAILKAVNDLTVNLKNALKDNEALADRVKELENQPASRKTSVEVDKTVGDEDEESKDAEVLAKARDKKIAEVQKKHANSPDLFSRIQKIRVEYAEKVKV